jgi:virginiamycin B lyase
MTLDGVFAEFTPPTTNPFSTDIIAGPDGKLWFSVFGDGQGYGKVATVTSDGAITEYPTSVYPDQLAFAPDGGLWFAAGNALYRYTALDGTLTQYKPTQELSSVQGIVYAPDGNIWFTDIGTTSIGRLHFN